MSERNSDINVGSLHDSKVSFHVLAKVAHSLVVTIIPNATLRFLSSKNEKIKKKFEEIEDISELHLLSKYSLVLNPPTPPPKKKNQNKNNLQQNKVR